MIADFQRQKLDEKKNSDNNLQLLKIELRIREAIQFSMQK